MRNIIYIAILIRIVTNIQQASDVVYFIGRDIFEIAVLYYISKQSEGTLKAVCELCMSMAVWNLIKPIIVNPRITDYYEVMGLIIGIIFIYGQKLISRYRTRH